MSLWICAEHGLYGGQMLCPKCGDSGSHVTLAFCGSPASAIEAATAGETTQIGSTEGESAVPSASEADAQKDHQ